MRVGAHVTFYYVEDRLKYLNQVIEGLLAIPHPTTVYIHSSRSLQGYGRLRNVKVLVYEYPEGNVWQYRDLWQREEMLQKLEWGHRLSHRMRLSKLMNPYYLTWENRRHVRKNIDQFDVQLCLEDDIAFTESSFAYWLKYKHICVKHGYNLGFLRTEVSKTDELYMTDLTASPSRIVKLEGTKFILNDINPYCGFWIYDREELKKFVNSREWKFKFGGYGIREKSAVGWHGIGMTRYKGTIIPLVQNDKARYETDPSSAVRHLPNNYIGDAMFCKIRFPISVDA